MATVEILEKQPTEMPRIEESVETSDKEMIKFIDEDDDVKDNDIKKENEVIGDGLKKDKLTNNVSCASRSVGSCRNLFLLPFFWKCFFYGHFI